MISLQLPVRDVRINQPFGANYLSFYKQFGLYGHNGVDFDATTGFKIYAAHSGVISFAKEYGDGGAIPMRHVEVTDDQSSFKTIYLHLDEIMVVEGQHVIAGEIIGTCDNSGKYTTGTHLHFGLKEIDSNGNTKNYYNGYHGAIDPTPYFNANYQGVKFNNKDCYKSNAYHRYFRGRPKGGLQNEWRIVRELTPYFWKNGRYRLPNNEEINACTYGAWDREALFNPAMYNNWAYKKKSEIIAGHYPFQD